MAPSAALPASRNHEEREILQIGAPKYIPNPCANGSSRRPARQLFPFELRISGNDGGRFARTTSLYPTPAGAVPPQEMSAK